MSRIAPDVATAVSWARAGQESMVVCPAHDDNNPSLSVGPGNEGQPVVFKCHANCESRDIITAAGLSWGDVCGGELDPNRVEGEVWTPRGNASHVYQYVDEYGRVLFEALRVTLPEGGKTFFQRQPDSSAQSGYAWNLQGVRRVLYRLPQVIAAVNDGKDIWVVEGEKDADRACADGKVATCAPMGAGKWNTDYGQFLTGARVTIVADADEPGRKHAMEVYDDLVSNHGCEARIVESPLHNCKDYSDHRQHGGTDESFITTHQSWTDETDLGGLGIQDFLETDFPQGRVIIPGLLAQANVMVLVGPEGHGKSLAMRQIAVQCAAGIVPFTGARMAPLNVLFIDAENPEFQQKEDWSRLVGLAVRHTQLEIPNQNLQIMSEWRAEPDLTSPDGAAWLLERINRLKPDLCLMGPVQNLCGRDVKDDEVVRRFKRTVNTARAICGTAFIIEHHAPHRSPGDKVRQMRPYGSSLFMKWPDLGYGMTPTDEEGIYDLYPFRRPRVRSRAWPERIRWGTPNTMEFPWEEAPPEGGSNVVSGNFGGRR